MASRGISGPSDQIPIQRPQPPKSNTTRNLVITAVAIVAIAALGLALGVHFGHLHIPTNFLHNHTFQLAAGIGGGLTTIGSVAFSILHTARKKHRLSDEEHAYLLANTQAVQQDLKEYQAKCHPKSTRLPIFEEMEVTTSQVPSKIEECDIQREDALKKDSSRANPRYIAASKRAPLTPCQRFHTQDQSLQFASTQNVAFIPNRYQIDEGVVSSFSRGMSPADSSNVSKTISATYKKLARAKIGFFKRSLTEADHEECMAKAIKHATAQFGDKPYALIVKSEGKVFLACSENMTVAYAKNGEGSSVNSKRGAVTILPERKDASFVVGNSLFWQGVKPADCARVIFESNPQYAAQSLLFGSIISKDPTLAHTPTEIDPVTCAIFKA